MRRNQHENWRDRSTVASVRIAPSDLIPLDRPVAEATTTTPRERDTRWPSNARLWRTS